MHDSMIRSEERIRPPKGRGLPISEKEGDASSQVDLATASVLVVDDQPLLREAVAFEFDMLGCKTFQAENGEQALETFQQTNPTVIISDIRMPVWDGVRLLEELRRIAKQKPAFIFMSGFSDLQMPMAYQRGADAFLSKPLYPDVLESTLKRVLLPMEERWQTLPTTSPSFKVAATYGSLEEAMVKKEIMVGRSGLFLEKSLLPKNFGATTDQLVAFQFTFKQGAITTLEGVGRVRWVRQHSNHVPAGIGIEHEFLVKAGRERLVRYVRDHQIVPVIPDGTVQA